MNLVARTALAVGAVGTLMLGLIGGGGYVLVRERVAEAEQARVGVQAQASAARVSARLQRLVQIADDLSRNLVIRNALLDSSGRETYVQPMLRSLARIDGQPVWLALVDYQGRSILDVGSVPAPLANDDTRVWLRARIDGAAAGARAIARDGVVDVLLIAVPVLMPNTRTFEGAFALAVPAAALLADLDADAARFELREGGSGADIALRAPAPLDGLQLALHAQSDRRAADDALAQLRARYLALGLAGVGAMVVLSVFAARRLTGPVRGLAQAAQRVAADASATVALVVPAGATDEVAVLAQSIAQMLARLREAAEAERHGVETQFRALFDHSPIGMTLADVAGARMRSNPAFAQMIGYSPQELERLDYLTLTHPEDRARNRALLEATVAGRLPGYRFEKRMRRKDGEYIWVSVVTSPLRDRDGRVTGVVSQVEDITARRAADAALAEAHARIAAVVAAVPDLWFVIDAEGRYVDVSDPRHPALFAPWESIRGRSMADFVAPEVAGPALAAISGGRGAEPPEPIEYVGVVPGAGRRYFEARFAPMRESRWLFLARDITERKRAEERMRGALREKEVLLQEIYHRVKNNLQVIASLLSLQGRDEHSAAARARLEDSANRVKSMALVHEQLYRGGDLSSIDFAAYLTELARHVAESQGDAAQGVRVVLDAEPLTLGIETAVPLGLIVNELLSNAYKHAFPGGRAGTVVLAMRKAGEREVEVVVADDGVGPPEAFVAPDGTGLRDGPTLGLRLIASLTEQIEGRIGCSRSESGGTRFVLRFVPDAPESRRMAA